MQLLRESWPPDKTRKFLDYLNSELRRHGANGGSGDFSAANEWRTEVATELGEVDALWTITTSEDLSEISVEVSGYSPQSNWSSDAETLIRSALAAALAEHTKSFFRRFQFHYFGSVLDGEYWLPGLRLAPAHLNEPNPSILNQERVVFLDLVVDAVDEHHATTVALERVRRYAARLSLLIDIGLYPAPAGYRWAMLDPPSRVHLGYQSDEPLPVAMPKEGTLCRLGEFCGQFEDACPTSNQRRGLPVESRALLRAFESGPVRLQKALDGCAALYQVGMVAGQTLPTVRSAYLVAAVEAAALSDPDLKGFSAFMNRYLDHPEHARDSIKFLYEAVRCAHFHAGRFPLGEFIAPSMDITGFVDDFRRMRQSRTSHELIRSALGGWIRAAVLSA